MLRSCRRAAAIAALAVLNALFLAGSALAAGEFDTSFNGTGLTKTDVVPGTISRDTDATDTLVLADGRVLVVGESNNDIFAARFLADGTLDASFGGVRIFDANFGSSPDDVNGIDIDSSGRLLIAGRADNDAYLMRITTGGELDTSFGSGGRVIFSDPGNFTFSDVGVDSGDGIYVLLGGYPSTVRKYTSAGVLDASFGIGGVATAESNMNDTKLAIDNLDRVVVGGNITGGDYRVYRLQAPGDASPGFYDTSFDSDGHADFTSWSGAFMDIEVDTDNRPLLLGGGLGDGFEIARLTTAGAADATFDSDGVRTVDPVAGATDSPYDLVMDGYWSYVGGGTDSGAANRGFITAFGPTGALDTGFVGASATLTPGCDSAATVCPITGIATKDNATDLVWASQEMALPSVTRIYAGKANVISGALTGAFGGDGRANHQSTMPWNSRVLDSHMTADGSIYSVGEYGQYGQYSTYIYKQLPGGGPDPAFGAGGHISIDLQPGSDDYVSGITVTSSGAVYVTGYYPFGAPSDSFIARFNNSGLDTLSGFGAGGIATITPSANDTYIGTITVDASDRLVVGGGEINGGTRNMWLGRYSSATGAADPGFNSGSARFLGFSGDTNESVRAITIGSDGTIHAVGEATGKLGVARFDGNGNPAAGFGVGGISEITALGTVFSGSDSAITVGPGGVFVGASLNDGGNSVVRVARIDNTGAVDASFGSGAGVTVDTGSSVADEINDLGLDSAGRLLVAGEARGGSGESDSLLARITGSGALDTAIDGDGILVRDHSEVGVWDDYNEVFARSGKIVTVGNTVDDEVNALLTVQMLSDPAVTPQPGVPPVDKCTPAKKKLAKYKKLLKKQKKALRKAKSSARKKKLRKSIKKTNKRIKSAKRSVRKYCA